MSDALFILLTLFLGALSLLYVQAGAALLERDDNER